MKKNLLICLLTAFSITVSSQVLWQDNFDSYEVGNFTDQGGWIRDGGEENWVQIVELNPAKGKSIQMFTTTDNDSGIFVTHLNNWDSRDAGKDIIHAEFDFYTGQPKDGLGMVVISTEEYDVILEVGWEQESNRLYIGGSNMDEALLESPDPDTWYHISVTYNTITGEVRARIDEQDVVIGSANPGMYPSYFDYTSIMEAGIGIDNIVVSATNTDVLKVTNLQNSVSKSKIYPNPATDLVQIKSDKNISTMSIFDLSGKLMKTVQKQNAANVQNLIPGNYVLKINYQDGSSESHQLIKK